jgi:hypothetical protein
MGVRAWVGALRVSGTFRGDDFQCESVPQPYHCRVPALRHMLVSKTFEDTQSSRPP